MAVVGSFSGVKVIENGTLFSERVRKQDSGVYLCQAQNGVGQAISKSIQLDVRGKLNGSPIRTIWEWLEINRWH